MSQIVPETIIERLQRFAARQPMPASQEDIDASMPIQREADRSAKAEFSPVAAVQVQILETALSRYENNLSDARLLAEDAACLARAAHLGDDGNGLALATLAQAKALASIALSMAFGGAS